MYSVTVRESVMIAHSLNDPSFGPAQNLHGATFVVDVEFLADTLSKQNVVIDIGAARELTKEVLATIAYKNLDELDQFKDVLTTAEFLAQHIHAAVRARTEGLFDGKLRVRLRETHDAWASYED